MHGYQLQRELRLVHLGLTVFFLLYTVFPKSWWYERANKNYKKTAEQNVWRNWRWPDPAYLLRAVWLTTPVLGARALVYDEGQQPSRAKPSSSQFEKSSISKGACAVSIVQQAKACAFITLHCFTSTVLSASFVSMNCITRAVVVSHTRVP